MTDQAGVQAAILADFLKTKPDTVILFEQEKEPNLSGVDSGVSLLDDALAGRCHAARRIAKYQVLTCQWGP